MGATATGAGVGAGGGGAAGAMLGRAAGLGGGAELMTGDTGVSTGGLMCAKLPPSRKPYEPSGRLPGPAAT
jgi:hypothetical protein